MALFAVEDSVPYKATKHHKNLECKGRSHVETLARGDLPGKVNLGVGGV